jgi:hypothetical protein
MDANNYKIYHNSKYEVLTETGFKSFRGFIVGENKHKICLGIDNRIKLICTPKHKLMMNEVDFIYAKDVKVNTVLYNEHTITSVETFVNDDKVYELLHVEDSHKYFTNNILSHQCLIVDEMAFIENHLIEDFWKSVIPVVSSGKKSKIFTVSTPNGTDNKFYEVYSGAEKGTNSWKAERVDWWDIPGRTEKWKQQMISTLGSEESFLQEFGNVFLDPGNSAVGAVIIERFKENKKNPIFTLDNGNYKVFENPDINKFYVIGVDVGEGIGRASSVAQVLDITNLKHIEQVAVYASNCIEPYHFANNLVKLCNQWGNPPLLVERNNCGGQVIDALFYKHEYEKIVSCSKISPTNTQASRHLGILSHTNLRFAGVTNMRYWTNTLQSVNINDIDTIKELETFIKYPNGTYRKKNDNFYDDRVMSLVWALFILEPDLCQQYFQVDDHDNQGKPLSISDIGYWEKDPRLYGIRELSNSEVITPSISMSQITNLNSQPVSLFNDKDLFPEEEKDIWDLTTEGWKTL